jgi:hypothetical protein
MTIEQDANKYPAWIMVGAFSERERAIAKKAYDSGFADKQEELRLSHQEYIEHLRETHKRELDACWEGGQENGYEKGFKDGAND